MRRSALAMAVLLVGSLSGSVVVAAPAGAATTITVDPSTDLVAGQTVLVSGGGFTPLAPLGAAQCKAGALTTGDCDLNTSTFPQADDDGDFVFNLTVRTALNTPNGFVDCTAAAGACVVSAAEISDLEGTAVSAPLAFIPPGPPHGGVLHAPAGPVAANEGVEITGTGFAPYALILTNICADGAADATDCDSFPYSVNADAAGDLSFFPFPTHTLTTQNGDEIDCDVDGACVYAAWDFRDFAASLSTAPVRIAPEVPGTITVTPSTDLEDADEVTLSGTGWPANLYLEFSQCESSGPPCIGYAYTITDENGAFSTPYTVRRVANEFGTYLNCEINACAVFAFWYAGGIFITANDPIAFDLTTTAVTSDYTNDELTAVAGAAATLGISNSEVQHLGAWALAWVLALTGTDEITPVPDSGPGSITTEWLPSEYAALTAFAAAHGTTRAEFQKTGALLLAYVLTLS